MVYQPKPVIDMTPDGRFRSPEFSRSRTVPLAARVALWAMVIAVVAGAGLIAALAAWIAFLLIPVVAVAGVVAYLAFRFQIWRARFSRGRSRGYPGDVFRP